uniref:Uncharacterized protein n=1 Tax=Lotus japonicus TaxID=34305 RepID=I3SH73_LOTJA|nr:unknown [Lotus japonicus]
MVTTPTTDPRLNCHAVTRHQTLHLSTNCFYYPSTLMTNNHWFFNYEVCTSQFLEVVNITSTDSNSLHSHSDIMGS